MLGQDVRLVLVVLVHLLLLLVEVELLLVVAELPLPLLGVVLPLPEVLLLPVLQAAALAQT